MGRFSNAQTLLVRVLSGAVLDQALLSAANFIVGLVLIRHTSDLQYGYYILATNAFMLLTSLQNAFVSPALVTRFTRLDAQQHPGVIGSLYHEQRDLMFKTMGIGIIATLLLCALTSWLDAGTGSVLVVGLVCTLAIAHREYFRIVLLSYREPGEVLRSDLPYIAVLIGGVWLATQTSAPATFAIASMGAASLCSGLMLAHKLHRRQPWQPVAGRRLMREIAPLGLWSLAGAAIHWSFSQGYSYVVAGALDVTAVAAIAATRLLMMPINLLSTGIRSMMLPMTANWLDRGGVSSTLRKLVLFAIAIATIAMAYFASMWLLRDWIFANVMHKQFAQRDPLLLMWSAIFLVMVVRDQFIILLIARERFRVLTQLTLICAAVSLGVGWWAMQLYGQVGALSGMLLGELINLSGVALLVLRERRHERSDHPSPSPLAANAGIAGSKS